MIDVVAKSKEQKAAEASVDAFRRDLGPFVVAAEKTRMPMIFTDAVASGDHIIFANAWQPLLGIEFRQSGLENAAPWSSICVVYRRHRPHG